MNGNTAVIEIAPTIPPCAGNVELAALEKGLLSTQIINDDALEQLRRDHGVSSFEIDLPVLFIADDSTQSTWASNSDTANPYNWPSHRKIIIGTIFSFGQLIPIMSASMIAAALGDIAHDLKIGASTAQITLSAYFLGMAFAPFLIAAMSEMYGRKRVWVACNAWYILWNALCPVGNSAPLMIVGRLMTGAGASVGVTVSFSSSPAMTRLIAEF